MIKYGLVMSLSFLAGLMCCQIATSNDSIHLEIQESLVDSIFREYVDKSGPGVALSILHKGSPILNRHYGMARLSPDKKIDQRSLFSLASVSKQFTAFAILLLEKEGKLDLEDDIRKYLANFKDYDSTITIRMLLNHSSGIRSFLQLLGQKGFDPNDKITQQDVEQVVYAQEGLNFEPGSQFSYSNSGYFLAAQIVEQISGMDFPTFVKEQILDPLKMNSSFVMDDFTKEIQKLADSYSRQDNGFVKAPADYSHYGSSNLYSSLEDMIKWGRNFEFPTDRFADIVTAMNEFNPPVRQGDLAYDHGQFMDEDKNVIRIYHSGSDAAYRTYLARYPEKQLTVILLSNDGSIDIQSKADQLTNLILKSEPDNVLVKLDAISSVTPKAKLNVEKFEGYFFDSQNTLLRRLSVENGALFYVRPEQNNRSTKLMPNSSNEFQLGEFDLYRVKFFGLDSMVLFQGDKPINRFFRTQPFQPEESSLLEYRGEFYSDELETTYTIVFQSAGLQVEHEKIQTIRLTPIQPDIFLGSGWHFNSLEFFRDDQGAVEGLKVSSNLAKGVTFYKQ